MQIDNKPQDYTKNIVISILALILILVGIAYNSLRNENIELGREVCELENELRTDQDDMILLAKKVYMLEDQVYKPDCKCPNTICKQKRK